MAKEDGVLSSRTEATPENMNIKVLKPSRKRLRPGDIFIFQMKSEPDIFRFGRVIRTDASVGFFENLILIYVYKATSHCVSEIPPLRPSELLVPPMTTNRLGWVRGYFETVANRPLTPADLLPAHHFRDSRGKYFDDDSNEVSNPIPPVGEWGLASFGAIDIDVSEALGIPVPGQV